MNSLTLIEELEKLLCDMFVELLSYKKRHWDTRGGSFLGLHELYDEATDELLEFIDTIGEYIVLLDGSTDVTLTKIVEKYEVPQMSSEETDTAGMLMSAFNNAKYLKVRLAHVSDIAADIKEKGLVGALEDMISRLDKLAYKYTAMMKSSI